MNPKTILLCTLATFLSFDAPAADEMNVAAKKIYNEKKDSVVMVSAIAKLSFTGSGASDAPVNIPDKESKVEALGTIVDASGLIVTVLEQIDPSRSISGRTVPTAKGPVKIEASSTIKEVKVIMADGTEIPAEIVMKDADLDLAFIRIKTDSKEAKGLTFQAVDLKSSGKGDVMDEIVTLARTDEGMNRAPVVMRGQINMITKTPRTFLRGGGATAGCPTFLADGKLLGITTGHSMPGKNASAAVIIPAADVLEIAEQAKNAKPPVGGNGG